MSYLQNQMNLLRFDKRLLEINLKNGNITQGEYDQHLIDLRDDTANSETLDLTPEDSSGSRDSMNGNSHPASGASMEPTPPKNTDPFGSGF